MFGYSPNFSYIINFNKSYIKFNRFTDGIKQNLQLSTLKYFLKNRQISWAMHLQIINYLGIYYRCFYFQELLILPKLSNILCRG